MEEVLSSCHHLRNFSSPLIIDNRHISISSLFAMAFSMYEKWLFGGFMSGIKILKHEWGEFPNTFLLFDPWIVFFSCFKVPAICNSFIYFSSNKMLQNALNQCHGRVFLSRKWQAEVCIYIKSNTSPWLFSRFLNCTNSNQIEQNVSYSLLFSFSVRN